MSNESKNATFHFLSKYLCVCVEDDVPHTLCKMLRRQNDSPQVHARMCELIRNRNSQDFQLTFFDTKLSRMDVYRELNQRLNEYRRGQAAAATVPHCRRLDSQI